MDPRLLVMFYIYQTTDVQELKWIPDCIQLSIAVNLVDCIITFESVNVMDCYRITFESVDLPEGFARNTVVQMNKGLACIHPYFHWNTITITATTIAIIIIHSHYHCKQCHFIDE